MNYLNISFLLAAAAYAAHLDATDYLATWSGAGGTATATLSVNDSLFLTSGNNMVSSSSSWLTSFNMTVTNGTTPITFTKADLNHGEVNLNGFSITSTNVLNISTATINLHFGAQNGPSYIHQIPANWMPFGTLGVNGGLEGPYMGMPGSGSVYGEMNLVSFSLAGPSGVTDVASWMSSINNQNRIYQTGVTLAELPLEGAHHRPMLSFDRMGKEHQAWATGDFGASSRTRDVHVTTGEAGLNWNLGKTGLIGFAAGHGEQNADLAYNGSSTTKGDYALVEYDYRPEGTQWIVSLLGMVGSWESKTNRGYTSGASTDFSYGVADIISRSARLRVDAPALVTFGGFGFAPYASYSVTQTTVGGYTETGGAFPATFDEQSHNAQEGRIGVTASKDCSAATKLLLTVEAIHRFDGVGPSLTGQDITGGVSFSLPGVAPRADCVRFGFDVDHKLNENTLLNVSAHVATVGEAHDVSAAISVRRAF
ncbi:MAG: hypothetical protein RLZ85_888 [Verrucomicrobiota bacterium]